MTRVLLAGESWISTTTEYKGYDSFTSTKLESGCEQLLSELRKRGNDVVHLFAHDVPEKFPWTVEELNRYDVVILSDIGANSFLLPNKVFGRGEPTVNRLRLLQAWVRNGGRLMMAGGYLSFSGFEGKAHYHGTPIEEVLPVEIDRYDDRVEVPQGVLPRVTQEHEITKGLGKFPPILGYQDVKTKPDSTVLLTVEEGKPLLIVHNYQKGKTLAYMSDIGPHWASQEFINWSQYGDFFGQCIDWLAN